MKPIPIKAACLIVLVGGLFVACASTISDPAGLSASRFTQKEIDQGRMLAGLGNCAACHTFDPSKPYAGGLPVPTPFGTIYTTNITPDPDSGLGRWSEADFVRAMRRGIDREGEQLFPAFPFTHFVKVKDEDLNALFAYLTTITPVNFEPPENTLRFPYKMRWLQAGWKALFFDESPWQAVAGKSDEWNRGAYLAEGLGHCTACHSPRNSFGAERTNDAYGGAMVDKWYAPALNARHEAPISWTFSETYDYLRLGGSALHGVALGSMGEVVAKELRYASDEDIRALATYISDIDGDSSNESAASQAKIAITAAQSRSDSVVTPGSQIYAAACASCHFNSPDKPSLLRPEMSLNSAIALDSPDNLIRATLDGVSLESGLPGVMMPGFSALSDNDIVDLLQFMRQSQVALPPWENLSARVAQIRQDATSNGARP